MAEGVQQIQRPGIGESSSHESEISTKISVPVSLLNSSGINRNLPPVSFYRRPLGPPSVAFNTVEGRSLFRDALETGFLESYFALVEHFTTQSEPSYCGIASLSMALNALSIDPGRIWKGNWRWFDDSMMNCCEDLEVVKLKGITISKVACLARCNGAEVDVHYASNSTEDALRQHIKDVCCRQTSHAAVVLAAYNRPALGQTGSGHFSPIAAYSPASDMVLIMDVARFKYPPHWVPLAALFSAMCDNDEATGHSRGFLVLSRKVIADGYSCNQEDCAGECL